MTPRVMVLYNEPMNTSEPSEVGVVHEAEDVMAALESMGTEVEARCVSRETLLSTLRELEHFRDPTVVFNLCEGLDGHAHHEPLMAGLLELHGLPFTGSPSATLSWALNKRVAKAILRSAGVPTPDARVFARPADPAELEMIPFPSIVKPVREDGSVGIWGDSVVTTVAELSERIRWVNDAFRQPALVERYLPGREFNLSVTGEGPDATALPVEEIVFQGYLPDEPRLLSHDAKWKVGSHDDVRTVPVCPAEVDETLGSALETLALQAYQAFGCRDYARIDVRLDADGIPFVIDVNPNPDISRVAGMALAATKSGLSYEEFVGAIVEAAWKRSR